jgi:hypothetical protein
MDSALLPGATYSAAKDIPDQLPLTILLLAILRFRRLRFKDYSIRW